MFLSDLSNRTWHRGIIIPIRRRQLLHPIQSHCNANTRPPSFRIFSIASLFAVPALTTSSTINTLFPFNGAPTIFPPFAVVFCPLPIEAITHLAILLGIQTRQLMYSSCGYGDTLVSRSKRMSNSREEKELASIIVFA